MTSFDHTSKPSRDPGALLSVSVVVPVYNSETTLDELIARLAQALPGISRAYEVVLVNDGSQDGSWAKIVQITGSQPWVRGVNLMRNYGQHNALLCGIRAARYQVIVTMDDDLQHPPEEIHKLLEKLAEGYDVVYASPEALPHSWWRNWFSRFTKRALAYLMGIKTVRDIGPFRAFRSDLRKAFDTYQNPSVLVDALLSWGTTRFAVAKVNEQPRPVGRSNYNFYKLFGIAMEVLTGFSTIPLRLTSLIGFVFTLFGVVVFIYVLVVFFVAGSIPGFPFLASIISLFSGSQLFALGIFGEYLARIFDRSMDRPPYVIGETTAENQLQAKNALEAERAP
ncbi:MAG: glycosyltransferase family 2 protein [Anaerolineales bacterium]